MQRKRVLFFNSHPQHNEQIILNIQCHEIGLGTAARLHRSAGIAHNLFEG